MFSVIISEKGGSERREAFDRAEVNVGRVQGNDLMLPKGNVSKRHARLLCRDGRFIVTDLKSTNGTYVNGRKIAQATIVREGDKIYIGDFILRIETGAARNPSQTPPAPAQIPADDAPSDLQSVPPVPPAAADLEGSGPKLLPGDSSAPHDRALLVGLTGPPGAAPAEAARYGDAEGDAAIKPPPLADPPSSSRPSSGSGPKNLRALAPVIENKPDDSDSGLARAARRAEPYDVISHFPLEHDPDESLQFAVPAPPRVPSASKPLGKTMPAPGVSPDPRSPSRPAQPGPSRVPLGQPSAPTAPGTPFQLPPPPGALGAPRDVAGPPVLPPPLAERATSPSVGLAALGLSQATPPPAPLPRVPAGAAGSVADPITPQQSPPGLGAPRAQRRTEGSGIPAARPRPASAADAARQAGHAARRSALVWLVQRVYEIVDLSSVDGPAPGSVFPTASQVVEIERALSSASAALGERGDVDPAEIVAAARRELCDLGPLARVFEDEDITELSVLRFDHVVPREGRRALPLDIGFSSDDAVGRAVRRLCVAAGAPVTDGEVSVERRLARGARLFAMLPALPPSRGLRAVPLAPRPEASHLVVIRKPARAEGSLEEMVRSGTISRAMASFLGQCVAARVSILVVGAVDGGGPALLGALAGAGEVDDRVVVLQGDEEILLDSPNVVSLSLGETREGARRAVEAAARIAPERLLVGAFGGAVAADVADAMGDGTAGVLAAARAPSLRQAIVRLGSDIAAARAGVSVEAAREQLGSMFDVVIEIARLRDGRLRVLRIAELDVEGGRPVVRDLFTFTVERTAAGGAVEGTFAPTEVIPRVVADLEARGLMIDSSLFRRHGKNDSGDDFGPRPSPAAASTTAPNKTPGRS